MKLNYCMQCRNLVHCLSIMCYMYLCTPISYNQNYASTVGLSLLISTHTLFSNYVCTYLNQLPIPPCFSCESL